MLYFSTSVWVLRTPNAGRNSFTVAAAAYNSLWAASTMIFWHEAITLTGPIGRRYEICHTNFHLYLIIFKNYLHLSLINICEVCDLLFSTMLWASHSLRLT